MSSLRLKTVCAAVTFSTLAFQAAHAEPLSPDNERVVAFENGVVARDDFGDANAQRWTIDERLAEQRIPAVAVAVIEDGAVVWSKGYGVKTAGGNDHVDADTVFSVGSISKMANAAIILRLVAEGLIDLDTDVNDYLTSWQVPSNQYTEQSPVTLRKILAHTAGFNQHGFGDFQPGEALPTALQTLEGQSPAKHGPIRVTFTPGDHLDYSGGGITVSQVLVEDVTGLTYEEAAQTYLFDPLGMTRSTFQNPLPAEHGNIARAHNAQGNPTALPRGWEAMPEIAASGLWTSANDLSQLVLALMKSYRGESDFLPRAIAADMMTRVNNSWHGLGPRLNGEGETRVFHHGGANNSYRAHMEGHLGTNSGIVLLTNGTRGGELYLEVHQSAAEAFDWPVSRTAGSYAAPDFVE